MKIIHGGGYSEEDKKEYKQQIYSNVYIAIQNLTNAMNKLKVSFDSAENEVGCCHGYLSRVKDNNNTRVIK